MIMRMTVLSLGAGQREVMEGVARRVNELAKPLQGFKGITFFMDEAAGEYGGVSFWDTQADADAAGEKLDPVTKDAVGDLVKAPPTRRLYEVFDPEA